MTILYYLEGYVADSDSSGYDAVFLGPAAETPSTFSELAHVNNPPILDTLQSIPTKLEFSTPNVERLSRTNIVYNDFSFNIISQPLIDAVSSTGPMDWTLIPAKFFNEGKEVCQGRFSAVYFNEHSEFFDYELSEYKRYNRNIPKDRFNERMLLPVRLIKKMVLKEPKEGFPPYFRLAASAAKVYVSSACREAILDAKIDNVRMLPAKVQVIT